MSTEATATSLTERRIARSTSRSARKTGGRPLLALGVLGILLLAPLALVPADASDTSSPGWSQVDLTQTGSTRAGDTADASIQLWARFSSLGAHLTLDDEPLRASARAEGDGLPHGDLDGEQGPANQVTFGVFDRLATGADGVHVQPGHAAWHTRLRTDVPVEALWRLSVDAASAPGTAAEAGSGAASRTLNVETRLVASSPDGGLRTLSIGVSQVTARAAGLGSDRAMAPTDVPVRLPVVTGVVHEDERLLVQLRWSWASLPDGEPVAPPLVTVHHGSWFRFGVEEPLRILDFEERTVLDGLFVKVRLAHLFSSDAIDLERLGLRLRGAGLTLAAPQRLVETEEPADGAFAPRAFRTDWRVPIDVSRFGGQEMELRLLARQVGDEGPRLLATRAFTLTPAPAAEGSEEAAGADAPLAGALLVAGVPLALLLQARRRRRQDHDVSRMT